MRAGRWVSVSTPPEHMSGTFPAVHTGNLHNCRSLQWPAARAGFGAHPALRTLTVCGVLPLTDAAVTELVAAATTLTTLHLDGCRLVTAAVVRSTQHTLAQRRQ